MRRKRLVGCTAGVSALLASGVAVAQDRPDAVIKQQIQQSVSTSTVNPNAGKIPGDVPIFDDGGIAGPGNDICTGAINVPVPGSVLGTNVGATLDTVPVCGTSIDAGGVWYTVTGNGNQITVITCSPNTNYDTKLNVYCGPDCANLFCVTGNDDDPTCTQGPTPPPQGYRSLVTWCSAPGQTYWILVQGFGGATGNFELIVNNGAPCSNPPVCGACDVVCSPDKVQENEPDCGLPVDTVNGGCNSSPTIFSPIALGDRICGTGAFDGATRDTDWYQLVITGSPRNVRFRAIAEFDMLMGIVDNQGINDCSLATAVNPFQLVGPCVQAQVDATLPAGTWWFFVAPQFTAVVPCGAVYNAELIELPPPPPTGACCSGPGLTSCSIISQAACTLLGGTYLGDNTVCGTDTVYMSADTPVAIPDLGTATSTVNVTDSNTITDNEIQVGMFITHTWQGDLTVTVTSPMGTPVTLVNRPGNPATTFGFATDNYGTAVDKFVLDDAVARIYDDPTPAVNNVSGKWHPDGGALNTLVGQNKGGIWTLTVTDGAGGDVGTVNTWCIIKKGAGNCPPSNPCAGQLVGDSNGDGQVDNFDIDAFVAALVNPNCNADPVCRCRNDINRDGQADNFDIDAFVACLSNLPPSGQPCP